MNFLKHIETITTNKKGINNFDNILETIKVKDIIEEQTNFDLIFVNDNDTVSKVLNIFKNHKIISTPVRNEQNKFIGIIDMLDLITFVSTKFDTPEILVTYSYEQMEQFANHPNISGRNTWIEISYQSSLNDLMKILSKKSCHRVAVSNEQGDIVGMITQFALVEWIYNHKFLFQNILNQTIEHSIWTKGVQSIHMKEFVIKAFKTMWEQEVSGLAVINDEGQLVANISATDLQEIRVIPIGETIHDLYQPIEKFLNIRTSLKDKIMMSELPKNYPIYGELNNTLEDIIEKIITKHVHRIFIVNDFNQPIGVISLGDIIKNFIEKPIKK